MEKDNQKIPEWLSWPETMELPSINQLYASRTEMFKALSVYNTYTRFFIILLAVVPSAVLLIMRLWPNEQIGFQYYLIAGIILFFMLPVGLVSVRVLRNYYQLYLASLIFTTRLHIALGYRHLHPWVERTVQQARKYQFSDKHIDNPSLFIEMQIRNRTEAFGYYRSIIEILSLSCFLCGIVFVTIGIG
ncbi:hypothetical protein ACFL6A_04800 [bacterium]